MRKHFWETFLDLDRVYTLRVLKSTGYYNYFQDFLILP